MNTFFVGKPRILLSPSVSLLVSSAAVVPRRRFSPPLHIPRLVFSGSAVSTTTDEGEGAGELVEESKLRVLNSLDGGGGESDEVAR
jgi:hypothetical protein